MLLKTISSQKETVCMNTITVEGHYEFSKAEQLPGESIDSYQIRLRHMAEGCKFQIKGQVIVYPDDETKGTVDAKLDYTDTMIRDRVVFGTTETSARKRLFREKEVTLGRAVETIRTLERAEEELKKMGHDCEVYAVRKKPKTKFEKKEEKIGDYDSVQNLIKCNFCGKSHNLEKQICMSSMGEEMYSMWEVQPFPHV
eukprot:GHVU01179742.1.p1 GENE.GHVU01179742.1~~GHVU01179742.1.p1  ORF type:complete len:198 (-),score=22.95 GHVU01179742.1:81-674(-)